MRHDERRTDMTDQKAKLLAWQKRYFPRVGIHDLADHLHDMREIADHTTPVTGLPATVLPRILFRFDGDEKAKAWLADTHQLMPWTWYALKQLDEAGFREFEIRNTDGLPETFLVGLDDVPDTEDALAARFEPIWRAFAEYEELVEKERREESADTERVFQRAYSSYQMVWMIDHGFSLGDLLAGLQEFVSEEEDDGGQDLKSAFDQWVLERGFGGGIWVCEDEFKCAEWQDAAYMKSLLSPDDYSIWEHRPREWR